MFHCNLELFLKIKRLEIVANEELLFPVFFSTAELLFEKLYLQNHNYFATPYNKLVGLKGCSLKNIHRVPFYISNE